MDRRTYLSSTATVIGTGLLAGCSGGSGTGTLATSVSDQPADIADFESLLVTIAGVWVKPADEEATTSTATGEDDGREYVEFDEPAEADLTELQGERSQLVGEKEVETGEYEFLQLDITGIDGTLTDGSDADVSTPGEAPLKFNQSFEIRADERTQFIADFTPVQKGPTGYVIQPVASETEVRYAEETQATTTA